MKPTKKEVTETLNRIRNILYLGSSTKSNDEWVKEKCEILSEFIEVQADKDKEIKALKEELGKYTGTIESVQCNNT